jgi:hypothetical protein
MYSFTKKRKVSSEKYVLGFCAKPEICRMSILIEKGEESENKEEYQGNTENEVDFSGLLCRFRTREVERKARVSASFGLISSFSFHYNVLCTKNSQEG